MNNEQTTKIEKDSRRVKSMRTEDDLTKVEIMSRIDGHRFATNVDKSDKYHSFADIPTLEKEVDEVLNGNTRRVRY